MHSTSALDRDAGRRSEWPYLLVLSLLAGAAVSAASVLGLVPQIALVLLFGAGLPALFVFTARPNFGLAFYLALLPLVLPWPVAAGLNAGEALTLGVMLLGVLSLWQAWPRVPRALVELRPVLLPLAGLAIVSVVSLLVNGIGAPEEIISALFKVLAFGVIAVLVHVHSDTPRKARRLFLAALLGAAVVALYAVVAYVLGWSYDPEYDWNRASGTFEHWNALGGFMALMSMPTLALAVSHPSPMGRLAFTVAFVLEIAALLMSLTLGSILALLVAGAFALVFLVRIGWRKVVAGGLLVSLVSGVMFVLVPALRDKVMNVDERVVDRLMTYAVGVSMFRDKFWFGFGSEQRLLDELWFGEADYGLTIFGASSSIPHNSFLKMGVEKGVFGVILFTLIIVGALRLLFRDWRLRQVSREGWLYVGTVVGVLAFLVQNMTNDLVLHARIGIVFFALIALATRFDRGDATT